MYESVTILGAGGHAKVVISTLRVKGFEINGVLDDDPTKLGSTLMGVRVVGKLSDTPNKSRSYALIAVGSNTVRRQIATRFLNMEWATVVHPEAYVDPSAEIGAGTVVFAGAVVQAGAVLGDHVIVNTGATVDHDCEIGDFAHVAPGAHLAGAVTVGEGAFFGIGSAAIPGVRVGAWTTVGAGGVVITDLPANVTAVGVPARVMGRGERGR